MGESGIPASSNDKAPQAARRTTFPLVAADVMTRNVVVATPEMALVDALRLMIQHGASGLPVVDTDGSLIGIITEGDLLQRAEIGTGSNKFGWLTTFLMPGRCAADYVRTHGRTVGELMRSRVYSIDEDTPLSSAAAIMHACRVKRLPVVDHGRIVGILSRADLVKALLCRLECTSTVEASDREIENHVRAEIAKQGWVPRFNVAVAVRSGIIELSGIIPDEKERTALRVIAENTPGGRGVRDDLVCVEPLSGAVVDQPMGVNPIP